MVAIVKTRPMEQRHVLALMDTLALPAIFPQVSNTPFLHLAAYFQPHHIIHQLPHCLVLFILYCIMCLQLTVMCSPCVMEAHPLLGTKDFVTFFLGLTDTVNIVAELLLDVQR